MMAPTSAVTPISGWNAKADDEIERDPGQVEQGDRPHAGQEGAQVVEVAQRLQAVAAIAGFQRQADQRVIDAVADRLVEAGADAHQDAAADQVEHAERGVKRGRDDDERDQVGTLWLGSTRS